MSCYSPKCVVIVRAILLTILLINYRFNLSIQQTGSISLELAVHLSGVLRVVDVIAHCLAAAEIVVSLHCSYAIVVSSCLDLLVMRIVAGGFLCSV